MSKVDIRPVPAADVSSGLSVTIQRVETLREEDAEECGVTAPTAYARETTRRLLVDASSRMKPGFPKGWVCLDWQGGIRIEWGQGERHVRLVVPPQDEGLQYVYHELDSDHGVDKDASGDILARWLDWLTQG